MVGAAGVANRERLHAFIRERLHPCIEDRTLGFDPLEIDTADLAAAVVDVEVRGELLLFRLRMEADGINATEVREHVFARAVQTLLFARPQTDADRSTRLEAERLEQTHRLEHHARPGAVVRRARS